jgi:hypothetical protein
MSNIGQLQLLSNAARKTGLGLTLALVFSTTITVAHAEKRTFNCSFVNSHSQSEAYPALSYARLTVGSSQASSLYSAYVSLKNECQANQAAKRVVNLSPDVVALIAAN